MKQNYFIVVLAHSIHGRLRRIHIPHQAIYGILGLAVLGCFSLVGFISSYARMALKVSSYNSLKQEAEVLRSKYQYLQKIVNQTDEQLATLKLNAKEPKVFDGVLVEPGQRLLMLVSELSCNPNHQPRVEAAGVGEELSEVRVICRLKLVLDQKQRT